ncbi:MAG TPA: substrate-binding domain-containing protein [Candidatus Binatia bacterium]|nr:substrate-binding domain-containing protein [Candidatus Binatia bacterium]
MIRNTEINVLSAGAVQPGMVKVIDAFRHETGHEVKVVFATAPAILSRIDRETPDIVIAPPAVLDELVKVGKVTPTDRVTVVGRIGVGLMVRGGAPLPMIGTIEEFKQSLLTAKSVVYNQASTGIYLEKLFERLGIVEHLKTKTVRYPDAAAVLDHVGKGKGDEIGFGATTVIIEGESKGLKFVGPLPPEIQNYTTYAAVLTAGSAQEAAREFIRFLTGPVAQKVFAAAGIQ